MQAKQAANGAKNMRNGRGIHLLSYCFALGLAGSLLVVTPITSTSFAFGRTPANPPQSNDPVTVSGLISDSRCGARHATESGNVPAQCARVCARRGARYVVVNGDTTYVLVGSETAFDAFAGQRAQVNGTLNGDTLKVSSIRAQ